jgi:hypothetical protein
VFAILDLDNNRLYIVRDYPIIYARPHPKTIAVLEKHTDALEMYKNYLPEYL